MRYEGTVESLWSNGRNYPFLRCNLEGIQGDRHAGFTKKADVRDKPIPKGTIIRNWRQWSAVSKEELTEIAEKLSLPHITAEQLYANICFSGIPDFTKLPRGSRIIFPSDLILSVEEDNEPCMTPARAIQRTYQDFNPSQFMKAAWGLRGLVGVIHYPGSMRVGDDVTVEVAQPRTYST